MLVPSGNIGREYATPRRPHFSDGIHYENDCYTNKTAASLFRTHDRSNRPASPLQLMENMKIDGEEGNTQTYFNFGQFTYHPSLLDDPELIAGKHSTRIALLTFSSYMVIFYFFKFGNYRNIKVMDYFFKPIFIDFCNRLRQTMRS